MLKYYRTIAFSYSVLKTSFIFENKFQILPLNMEGKPQNPVARHFPFFLEYTIEFQENEPEDEIELMAIRKNKEKEILNLLSCLTNHRFFSYDPSQNAWGIKKYTKSINEITEAEFQDFLNQESCFYCAVYQYEGLKQELQIESFSDFNPKAIYSDNGTHKYYIDNPIDSFQHEVSFPNTIYNALQNYYELSHKTREKVNSCIYLACDGMDISAYKKSLSFLSYVSAIEGLVDLEIDDDEIQFDCYSCKSIKTSPYTCPQCGRPIWGVKQKFVRFLSKFVASSETSQKTYKEIYNLRSKMTHTGKLFLSDYELLLHENNDKKDHNEWLMKLQTLQLFRISLDCWLRYENKKKH